jgi:phosphonoacetaldehyde hydrolase
MDFVFRRSYRGRIKLAVFDWAGTTIDHGCMAPAVVFVEVFRLRGLDITVQQARAPMGLAKKDHLRAITKQEEVAAQWRKVHGRDCTEQDVTDMFEQEFRRLEVETIARHSRLIPGTLTCVAELKKRGIKIGSSTGYSREATEINLREAARQDFRPDATFCAGDVPAGRPEPWMIFANMQATRTFPPEAVVKIGDTAPDIGEGLNAGVWTIGITRTGNEVGLGKEEIGRVSPDVLAAKVAAADAKLRACGAHYVVETIRDVVPLLDLIAERLRSGDRP